MPLLIAREIAAWWAYWAVAKAEASPADKKLSMPRGEFKRRPSALSGSACREFQPAVLVSDIGMLVTRN
jgi:hypothetical protein